MKLTKSTGVTLEFSHTKGEEQAKITATSLKGNTLELAVSIHAKVIDGSLNCHGKQMPIDSKIEDAVNDYLKECDNINKSRVKRVFSSAQEYINSELYKNGKHGNSWEQRDGTIAVYEYEAGAK